MKRFIIILIMLLSINSFSQIIVLLDEDFTGNAIPAGWSQVINEIGGTGTQPWTFGSAVMPGNGSYQVDNFPNNAAIFNDDAAGAGGQHDVACLRSPAIDAHLYTNASLKLRYQYAINNKAMGGNNDFDDHLRVFLLDNSGSLVQIADHHQTTNPVYHWIDIAQALRDHPEINPALFRIQWTFDDVDSSFGWGCGIDDVALIVHPENDDCSNAVDINTVLPYTTSQNAVGATNNNGFISTCGIGMNDGVWYTFTPTQSGAVTITVNPSNWDAEVAVYSGTCGNFTCVAHADDPETITDLPVTAGTQYFINIGYFSVNVDEPEGLYNFVMTGTAVMSTPQENMISGFQLFPNPAKNILHIKANQKIDMVEIYNILGQKMIKEKFNIKQKDLDIGNLPKGSYVLKVQSGNKIGSYLFIKQ